MIALSNKRLFVWVPAFAGMTVVEADLCATRVSNYFAACRPLQLAPPFPRLRRQQQHSRPEAHVAAAKRPKKKSRDVEKTYTHAAFIAKLRRLADSLETGKPFQIQIADDRINIPARATYNIEHERSGGEEEIEFQIKWKLVSD
jgi:amphi-Trp domain-containing protein